MSDFEVKAYPVVIHPHPNADKLELAEVGGYKAVVAKGQFTTGDRAIYIPEEAIVPQDVLKAINLWDNEKERGMLGGSQHNRVKTIRLRGEYSQGIACTFTSLSGFVVESPNPNHDYAEELGITKYVPKVPQELKGQARGNAPLVGMKDIQNLQKPEYLHSFDGQQVYVTEKIHGTCLVACYTKAKNKRLSWGGIKNTVRSLLGKSSGGWELFVSSKGMSNKKIALRKTSDGTYWKAALDYNLEALGEFIHKKYPAITSVNMYGEVYGHKVQDLNYGLDDKELALFDISVTGFQDYHFTYDEMSELIEDSGLDVPLVPLLYKGEYDQQIVSDLADLDTTIGEGAHMSEGVVVTAYDNGEMTRRKWKSPAYLAREHGTEYQ